MKRYGSLFLCLCVSLTLAPQFLVAQNWQNICSPGVTFYKHADHMLGAVSRKSWEELGNGDSLFGSYATIRSLDPYASCFDTTNGSVLGKTILVRQTGEICLFNYNLDTIQIQSRAPLNATFRFFDLPDGAYIEATVSALTMETFLTVTDSTRLYTLQAKDASHNNIPHALNQQEIKLSKRYGFIRIPDFPLIPTDTAWYDLAGKTTPSIGIQECTNWADIMDFDIGDEFHFSGNAFSYSGSSTWKYILTVLDKTVYGNTDSVSYVMEHCRHQEPYGSPPINQYDTIETTYHFIQLASDSTLHNLPDAFTQSEMFIPYYFAKAIYGNDRLTKGISPDVYACLTPGCWGYIIGEGWSETEYSRGLGKTRYHAYDLASEWHDELVYYRKGTETWGTPVAPDCQTLVGTPEVQGPTPTPPFLYPNPASGSFSFSPDATLPGTPATFRLIDYLGRTVFETTLRHPGEKITPPEHLKGLFLWQLTSATTRCTGRIMVK